MTKGLLFFSACALLMIAGCQKTELAQLPSAEASTDRVAEALIAKGTVSPDEWRGYYETLLDENGLEVGMDPDTHIEDDVFIHSGTATLPDLRVSGYSSFFSAFAFNIPESSHISGDSILLEASVQNLRSNSINNYDVVLDIIGTQHSLQVHFVADATSVAATRYALGSITKSGLPSLVNYFGTFQTIKLGTKKGQTAVYVNNKLLYRFPYKADNKIGDIYQIRLSGKGVASFDYVKLTNSVTNKKRMQEDFNIEGQSHTIFY